MLLLMELSLVGQIIGWLLVTALIGYVAGMLMPLPLRRKAAVNDSRWDLHLQEVNYSSDATHQSSNDARTTSDSLLKEVAQLTIRLQEYDRLKESNEKIKQL